MTLIHAHCLYLIEFAKLIKPKMKNQGQAVILESCMPDLKAALNKRNPDMLFLKIRLLIKVGVLVHGAQNEQESPS
ncbi:hypothetical protein MRX96_029713 [Rhipicephalus microplus]